MDGEKTTSKKQAFFNVMKWVIFPIGIMMAVYGFIVKRLKISITSKITFLYTSLYVVSFVLYAWFMFSSILAMVQSPQGVDPIGIARMLVVTIIFGIVVVLVFIALSAVASNSIVSPLRDMIDRIDDISGENLGERLAPVDTQDEIRELTEQINIMLDSIENSFNQQKYFVSDASHELRTPISVIHGYAELLKRWGKEDSKVLDESIDAILSEAQNMKKLVEQLLYLAKVGSFSFEATELNVSEVAGEVVENYQVTHADKTIKMLKSNNVIVLADKALLVELLRILIDNAIKYTKEAGKISIKCEKLESKCVISVKDNGIGISEEDLPHIFDRFYKCDKSRSRETGSVGLGLSIAKSITELVGGKIVCKSIFGEGTTFSIIMPAVIKSTKN